MIQAIEVTRSIVRLRAQLVAFNGHLSNGSLTTHEQQALAIRQQALTKRLSELRLLRAILD